MVLPHDHSDNSGIRIRKVNKRYCTSSISIHQFPRSVLIPLSSIIQKRSLVPRRSSHDYQVNSEYERKRAKWTPNAENRRWQKMEINRRPWRRCRKEISYRERKIRRKERVFLLRKNESRTRSRQKKKKKTDTKEKKQKKGWSMYRC